MKEAQANGTIFDIDMPYFQQSGAGFAFPFVGTLLFRVRFAHHRSETMPAALSNIARLADFLRVFLPLFHLLLVLLRNVLSDAFSRIR